MSSRRNWTKDEVRQALALYLRTDFGRFHNRNPDVIVLAESIGRSASAVALKLNNLASLDDSLPQKSMVNSSKTDRLIWFEFLENPHNVFQAYASQIGQFSANIASGEQSEHSYEVAENIEDFNFVGLETTREVPQRLGQSFFRKMILTAYEGKCALTGIEDTRLLNASHICAWKDDPANRLNPANGICLNALHDRAFDRHLITFDEDYRIIIAPHVTSTARRELERIDSNRLTMPTRFVPGQVYLEKHREEFYDLSKRLA